MCDQLKITNLTDYDQLSLSIITTNVISLKMPLNSVEIAFKHCGRLGQVLSPSSLHSHLLRQLPSLASLTHFAHSQAFTECYTKG